MINEKFSRQWKLVTRKGYQPAPKVESLRNRRIKLGIGLREMARTIGISHSHLSNVETGTRTVSAETAEQISAMLAVRQ